MQTPLTQSMAARWKACSSLNDAWQSEECSSELFDVLLTCDSVPVTEQYNLRLIGVYIVETLLTAMWEVAELDPFLYELQGKPATDKLRWIIRELTLRKFNPTVIKLLEQLYADSSNSSMYGLKYMVVLLSDLAFTGKRIINDTKVCKNTDLFSTAVCVVTRRIYPTLPKWVATE